MSRRGPRPDFRRHHSPTPGKDDASSACCHEAARRRYRSAACARVQSGPGLLVPRPGAHGRSEAAEAGRIRRPRPLGLPRDRANIGSLTGPATPRFQKAVVAPDPGRVLRQSWGAVRRAGSAGSGTPWLGAERPGNALHESPARRCGSVDRASDRGRSGSFREMPRDNDMGRLCAV